MNNYFGPLFGSFFCFLFSSLADKGYSFFTNFCWPFVLQCCGMDDCVCFVWVKWVRCELLWNLLLNVCWYALSKEEPYCNQKNPNPNEIQMICFFRTCRKGNDCKRYLEPKATKAACSNHIPTKISKDFEELFATFVYNNYNKVL